ncbi:MAG TPA: type VI secretion system baseplate subunit TssF [Cellvibrio sp.]|nr:type VI secretion system baseplate subunit TssF [Cellvibrio sp.]
MTTTQRPNNSIGAADTNAPDQEDETIFGEEMAFLMRLQTRFLNLHRQIPVEHNDPDVKYLAQAMAAFMAKGRMAGRHQIDQLHQRIFQQLLPYVTAPVPSMALIEANTRNLTESITIKSGSQFTLSTDSGEQAQYRSRCNMPLAPITIDDVGQKICQRNEFQIHIKINAHSRAPGSLDHLPIYLSVNNNFSLSLLLRDLFKNNLTKVSAVFDTHPAVIGRFHIGSCQTEATSPATPPLTEQVLQHMQRIESLHPVEEIRCFFQLPQQENYLNLYFSGIPQQWNTCEIILSLKGQWPRQLALSTELFHLAVVAIENKVREQAEPINFNATQSNNPIRPPSTAPDLRLLKCLGVYQGSLKESDALRPGILKGGSGSYDLHFRSTTLTGPLQPELDIHLPEAFKKPVKIMVDAIWHQPDFSNHLWKKLVVRTHYMDIPGLGWTPFDTPVPCSFPGEQSAQGLLDLSLLKNKRELSLDEILFILDNMGCVFQREFQSLKSLPTQLQIMPWDISSSSNARSSTKPCVNYFFSLDTSLAIPASVINIFFSKIEVLLNSWIPDVTIFVSFQGENTSTEKSISYSNHQRFAIFSETPIYDIADGVTDADYRLIPATPEHVFFIEGEDTSIIVPQGARHE